MLKAEAESPKPSGEAWVVLMDSDAFFQRCWRKAHLERIR